MEATTTDHTHGYTKHETNCSCIFASYRESWRLPVLKPTYIQEKLQTKNDSYICLDVTSEYATQW